MKITAPTFPKTTDVKVLAETTDDAGDVYQLRFCYHRDADGGSFAIVVLDPDDVDGDGIVLDGVTIRATEQHARAAWTRFLDS